MALTVLSGCSMITGDRQAAQPDAKVINYMNSYCGSFATFMQTSPKGLGQVSTKDMPAAKKAMGDYFGSYVTVMTKLLADLKSIGDAPTQEATAEKTRVTTMYQKVISAFNSAKTKLGSTRNQTELGNVNIELNTALKDYELNPLKGLDPQGELYRASDSAPNCTPLKKPATPSGAPAPAK
ncbi:hypothetical protein D5S17_13235 [Pseudonocardiaceae bacterium YIM PH 21723]|nr:hypothetical protein D5S17_13235 [Pseudonocardiaceae bacterium YIM PH 21723]